MARHLQTSSEIGASIASILYQSWRTSQMDFPNTAALSEEVVRLLLQSGTAALARHRLEMAEPSLTGNPPEFHQAYRHNRIRAAVCTHTISRIFKDLTDSAVSPIIGKGWAIARLYPDPGFRPYTDFDIYCRHSDYDRIRQMISLLDTGGIAVDLHNGVDELSDRPFEEILRRTRLVGEDGSAIRIFGAEDHLRLIIIHMLGHGAWRPLWLTDVAVALENRPDDFDWDHFLSGDPVRTEWAICGIGLASKILGADISGTPIEQRASKLPAWLVDTVLRQWGRPPMPQGARLPMKYHLRNPADFIKALFLRWPNGIEATIDVHGRFTDLPRLPYQLASGIYRSVRFFRTLRESV